ncbi:hypothetical protein C0J52_15372 [Blattella germanica]|nr:hypothetical protein C0J52_15372 [Blattella germanica]
MHATICDIHINFTRSKVALWSCEIFCQQDGTPEHYHLPVRAFLDNNLQRYWIGRRGSFEWPDLTPMGFYLWETVKDQVYRRKPRTMEGLRQEITVARRSHMQRSPLKQ